MHKSNEKMFSEFVYDFMGVSLR